MAPLRPIVEVWRTVACVCGTWPVLGGVARPTHRASRRSSPPRTRLHSKDTRRSAPPLTSMQNNRPCLAPFLSLSPSVCNDQILQQFLKDRVRTPHRQHTILDIPPMRSSTPCQGTSCLVCSVTLLLGDRPSFVCAMQRLKRLALDLFLALPGKVLKLLSVPHLAESSKKWLYRSTKAGR